MDTTTTWTTTPYGASVAVINFGVKDSKGREIGARIKVSKGWDGLRLVVRSTRDGQDFGAWPGDKLVASVDVGQQEGLAKAEENRRRVLKDAAKTGGVYLTAGERAARKRAAQ